MKLGKVTLVILCLTSVFLACNDDDDGNDIPVVEERDRTEQQAADKASLTDYLQSHYYNSSDFVSNANPSLLDLIISELPEDGVLPEPDNNTLLIDAIETHTTIFAETNYEYYILRLNQGGGASSPTFADDVRVNYNGSLLNDDVFDSTVNSIDLDLTQVIPGWRKVFPLFNVAESFVENGDGTVEYMDYGLGVMYLPSGLCYYSVPQGSIPSYSPLIFKFELFDTSENDHDLDGVPSYLEDLNGDGEFTIDIEEISDTIDDDTDDDNLLDYVDIDDDNDGVPTLFEDLNEDGDPTNDIGANGIPNYLDDTETESNQE